MRFAIVAALSLTVAMPAAAQLPDPMAMTEDQADRAVLPEVADVIASRQPDLVRLDAVLAKLPRPTPLRGMVQAIRAAVLAMRPDPAPAAAAVEEAMRLLPDDPRPKIIASRIYTFSGAPQRAADLWMQASRLSPETARTSDRYVMMALVGRLNDIGDRARADRLAARLGEIGFAAGLAPERSGAALAHTREAVRTQDIAEAQRSITAIGDPGDLLSLYTDRDYAALWPQIAQWAGDDLSSQSRRYLEELRGDWQAADDFETATPYARRLAQMRAYPAVVALFLPMLDRPKTGEWPAGIEFLTPVVARSLLQVGRGAEARALLAKVAAALPADHSANALNIDGSYLTLAATEADWPQVVARGDAFLARARTQPDLINSSATLAVQALRACALTRLGRTDDAASAAADVLRAAAFAPGPALDLHLCRGDVAAARALLIARLAEAPTRAWALGVIQPAKPDVSTPLARLRSPVEAAVRSAPDVIAAATKVGRILTAPVDAELPTGFDPYRMPPTRQRLGADAT